MLKMLMSQNVLVYVMLAAGVLGIGARILLSTYMGTLVKAAENMGTTRRKQLKKIRERFEDLGAVGYKIRNVNTFVERAVSRIKMGKLSIHSVEGFIKNMFIITAGAGIFGACLEYYRTGAINAGIVILMWGTAVCGAELIAGNLWDFKYRRYALQVAINDYFSNSLVEKLDKLLRKAEMANETEKTAGLEHKSRDKKTDGVEKTDGDKVAVQVAAAAAAPEKTITTANEIDVRRRKKRTGEKPPEIELSDEMLEQLISSVIG